MRVTTTIFTLEFPRQLVEARGIVSLQEFVAGAGNETEFGLRSFLSLYSGQNKIDLLGSSADDGA
jgi:hypothetical protein